MRPSAFGYYLGIVAGIAALAGCQASRTWVATPVTGQSTSALMPSAPENGPLAASAIGSHLYVARCCGVLNHGDVTVYDPGSTTVDRYVKRTYDPVQLQFDASRTLYVLNQWDSVTEYDPGNDLPVRKIIGPYVPEALTIDKSSTLYVADCPSCVPQWKRKTSFSGSVEVYAAEQTKPLRTITNGIAAPYALLLDSRQNLYVANEGAQGVPASITVYAPGASTPLRTIQRGITAPTPVAIDGSDELFVAKGRISADKIFVYAPHSDKIRRTITDGVLGTDAMIFDSSGTLYASNSPSEPSRPGWISVYPPGSSIASYRIYKGVNEPVTLALDRQNNLYVANIAREGWVSVYAPKSRKPQRYIGTGKFGAPRAFAFGPP